MWLSNEAHGKCGLHKKKKKVLTHTLKPDVVVVEATAAIAGVCRKKIGTLPILTNF